MAQSMFSPEQVSQLEQPLDPNRVKHRQGGGGAQLAYLKGHDMINTANRIFGFGNWGYDLVGVELVNVPGENGESVGSYYAARVRVSVKDCVPITEEGVCPVQEGRNPRARIDAHDMARKGAITDALKRALRCFGDQFGNSLYDTDLVDGQPRGTNGARPAQRPASAPPARPMAAQPAAAPRPVAAQPATPPAPRPITAQSATAPVQPTATNVELATDQQKQAIRKMALQRSMNNADVENQLQRLYGSDMNQLSKGDASDFIKRLNSSAA
jgi:DNA recombination protein Rad52